MNPRLISWNVRGLNQRSKRLKIRNLLKQWKADIICLQETKLDLISIRIVKSLWGSQFADWCYLPSSGASGGILLMWDRRLVEKLEAHVGEYVVACNFRNCADNFIWALAGVYGPNLDPFRRSLWNWLVCSVCRISLGALVATSMSSAFPVSVQVPLVFLPR